MTRQTMLEAARKLPRSPIYGIGVCRSGGNYVDFEIGWDDLERDTAWAFAELSAAGVNRDDHVLITTPNHENPWLSPVLRALRRIGATYTPAETYSWDSTRFVSVLSRLPITVVIGLAEETLQAIAAQESDLPDMFRNVRLIWARPEAHAELEASGVPSLLIALLGPALGLARPDAPHDLRVNAEEWVVTDSAGELVVSATSARRSHIADVRTGVNGRVVGTGDGVVRVQL